MTEVPVAGGNGQGRVVAVFTSRAAASDAAAEVVAALALRPGQVELAGRPPSDAIVQADPEDSGSWRSVVIAQWRAALLGAILGLVACACLYAAGIAIVEESPGWASAVLGAFGGACGLLVGALSPQRPRPVQSPAADADAPGDPRTSVVVQTESADQCSRVATFMLRRGADVTRTL